MYSGLPLHYSYAGPLWILAPSCGAAIESPEGWEVLPAAPSYLRAAWGYNTQSYQE